MAGCTVRKASIADLESLLKLGLAEPGFEVTPGARFYSRAALESWLECPGDDVLLVAQVEKKICGLLFCVIRNSSALLENVAVDPLMRGRGIGTALFTECIRELRIRKQRITHVNALVRQGNAAESFFDRLQFDSGYLFRWRLLTLEALDTGTYVDLRGRARD